MGDVDKKYTKFLNQEVRVYLTPLVSNGVNGEFEGSTMLSFGGIKGSLKSTGVVNRALEGKLVEESEEFLNLENCTIFPDLQNYNEEFEARFIQVKKNDLIKRS